MVVLNFSHPLTAPQRRELDGLLDVPVTDVREVPTKFDPERPFAEQAQALADAAGLLAEEWQTLRIAIVPPALAVIAATLLAELHGRMGYFPPVVRLKPVAGALPPEYAVAEVINLQAVRDQARARR